jgi:hypothetical protein
MPSMDALEHASISLPTGEIYHYAPVTSENRRICSSIQYPVHLAAQDKVLYYPFHVKNKKH